MGNNQFQNIIQILCNKTSENLTVQEYQQVHRDGHYISTNTVLIPNSSMRLTADGFMCLNSEGCIIFRQLPGKDTEALHPNKYFMRRQTDGDNCFIFKVFDATGG